MKLPFSLFLAVKYLKPRRAFMSLISVISVFGVMIGVAVLVVVLSVMSGFDEMWREKILGFDAHIIAAYTGEDAPENEETVRRIESVPGVKAAAPFVQGLVVVQRGSAIDTPVLRGVEPQAEPRLSKIPSSIKAGKFDIEAGNAVLGVHLAARLGVNVGDAILVYSPHTFLGRDEMALPTELRVAAIYEVGMWEYDVGFLLAGLETACDVFGLEREPNTFRVAVAEPSKAPETARALAAELAKTASGWNVKTWMELNRQLFGALKVEKNIMFFLLIFIVLVAAFGITSGLIIVVVQKTKEIGLLKAIGFSSSAIMGVFCWQGWIQGLLGTALGIAFGMMVLDCRNDLMRWLSRTFDMELFPQELYRLTEIPASTSATDVVLIAIFAVGICTLAGLLPALRAASLEPSEALRHE